MKPLILEKFIASLGATLGVQSRSSAQTRGLAATSLALIVGMTGGWVVEQAIAPGVAQAYTSRLAVTLTAEPGESFETLLRRAESVARAAAQRSFDRDILITDVSIVISAEYQSRIAPVLTLEATRNQWKSRPDTRRWATYYRSAKTLLGLDGATAVTTPTPTVTAPATPGTSPPEATQAPNSTATPDQPATGTTTTSDTAPTTNQPGRTQILPDRIPTPGGIGK